ncbi:MAG: leucine-rich repeat protein [Alloprevotella sp.]|nr:leucine-rich repeat protein [Alloprevotella sp.]
MKAKILTLLLNTFIVCAYAQSFESQRLKYNVIEGNSVEVVGCTGRKVPQHVTIPSTVSNGGKTYIVERIGRSAFRESGLLSVVLPNTIKSIGEFAFQNTSLESLKLPIGLERIEDWAFFECSSLKYVYFPPTPLELGRCCFANCLNLIRQEGYHSGITRTDGYLSGCFSNSPIDTQLKSDEIKRTFSYNYVCKIYKAMQEWQKKKPFETVDQWRTRVTNHARERKLQQLVSQFKDQYIKEQSANVNPQFTISLYDDDYNVYSLESKRYGVVYVSVPASEKDFFKDKFGSAKVMPTYCIKDDNLALVSVSVQIGQKTYKAPDMNEEPVANDFASMDLPPLEINMNDKESSTPVIRTVSYDKSLDENIPVSGTKANNTFVIAIGNENYQLVPSVSFAENDMEVFCKYCQKTLGVPISNIRKYKDATFGVMLSALSDLKDITEAYNGDINVLFYYAGHGFPDEKSRKAYLLPVDADGKQSEVCLPISRLYSELAALNSKSTVVFMDACFSGAQRGDGMLASARGVAIEVKEEMIQGNLVVFSAASGDETAYPYKEKGHGMFTYFLLKKVQETKGAVTLGELSDYIITNVKRQSVVTNRKSQTPTVIHSESVGMGWRTKPL